MILENALPVHVHNRRKIKGNYGGVLVSEPRNKEVKDFLKCVCLWTNLLPPTCLSVFTYFYLLGICINNSVLVTTLEAETFFHTNHPCTSYLWEIYI